MMLTIGLTGGIGCGKSTIAQCFQKLGITVIDADAIAHELVTPDAPAFSAIFQHFGSCILNNDGTINRKKLREIIFADTQQRNWLENLLHPLILREINQRKKKADSPYCILMIPLLLEKNVYQDIDRILVADATEQLQIKRVKQRDQLTTEQAKAIIATQISRQERLKFADDIIQNIGNLAKLHQQITALHQRYLQLAKVKV